MKAEELMAGDWVLYGGAKCKVVGFFYGKLEVKLPRIGETLNDVPLKEISPIPLTPEILEKNGFGKDKNGDFVLIEEGYAVRVMRRCDVYEFTIVATRGGITDMVRFTIRQVGPFSVHWVQHALRLCGIEKEITL